MPVTDYCTLAELKAALSVSDTADDAALDAAIDAASRSVDEWCGRRFYQDDADTVRYFTASGPSTVTFVGRPTAVDLVTLTELAVDRAGQNTYSQTYVEGEDFVLTPRNASADGWPSTGLRMLSSGDLNLPTEPEAIRVTGTFGWPSASGVPDAVNRATVALASQIFKQLREAPFGASMVDLDGGSIRMSRYLPGNVEMMLRPFRRVSTPGFV